VTDDGVLDIITPYAGRGLGQRGEGREETGASSASTEALFSLRTMRCVFTATDKFNYDVNIQRAARKRWSATPGGRMAVTGSANRSSATA
jgi:hypothetical protein